MFKKVLFVALLTVAGFANAADLNCSVWSTLMSRGLFFNSGTFVTTGPVLMTVPECSNRAGWYVNLFLIAPIGDFDTGKEHDERGGRRFNAGGLDVDASVAHYRFSASPGDLYSTWNGRVRLSHTSDLGKGTSVQPYVYLDYQYSPTLHDNAFAYAGGVVVDARMHNLPGKPLLSVDLGGWEYTTTRAPHNGPITSLQASLGYRVTNRVTFGPRAQWSWGNVVDTSLKPKNMWGVFGTYQF